MVKRRSRKRTRKTNKKLRRNNKSKRRTNKRYKKKMRGGMEAATATPDPPDSYLCPITQEIMKDPVADLDGYSYERSAITEWLERNGTSPITRKPLSVDKLFPNKALENAIKEWKEKNRIEVPTPAPSPARARAPSPAPAPSRAPAAAALNVDRAIPDNHPRRKWEEWKARYAPGEVQEPRFEVDQVTFTLDNLNIEDRYLVGIGNYPEAPVRYTEEFVITDFNYTESDERFMCEVILSNHPDKIEFIYNNPVSSRVGSYDGERGGWTTRWRSIAGGEVITCSLIPDP